MHQRIINSFFFLGFLLSSSSAMAWMGPSSDGFYRWSTSAQLSDPDSPAHLFTDLATLQGGTAVGQQLLLSDDGVQVFPLGGEFNFYGSIVTHVQVCANGVISFMPPTDSGTDGISGNQDDTPSLNCSASTRPQVMGTSGGVGDALVAGLWMDLNPTDASSVGEVWVFTDNDTTTIHWENVSQFSNPDNPATFQIILHHRFRFFAGEIRISYDVVRDLNPYNLEGDGAIVGLENDSASESLTVFQHQRANVLSGTTIRIAPCTAGFNFDGDSFDSCFDCNDFSASIGAPAMVFFADGDQDSAGDPTRSLTTCFPLTYGYVNTDLDCDDYNTDVGPGATESPADGVDQDCDGFDDCFADTDGDTEGSAVVIGGTTIDCSALGESLLNTDCDDQDGTNATILAEICDGQDNNCNALADDGLPVIDFYTDGDGDGDGDLASIAVLTSCLGVQPSGVALTNTDCDDQDAGNSGIGTEVCDGLDNDCDTVADNDVPTIAYFPDTDMDGDGDSTAPATVVCADLQPANSSLTNTDCDDMDADVNAQATEICDLKDNNCNNVIDEGFATMSYFEDRDDDGFGDAAVSQSQCIAPIGFVDNDTDCDPERADINPDATEIRCDGIDNDCDATTFDEVDGDDDGFGGCSDCDDGNAAVNPDASEVPYDGLDNDCDPETLDDDLDGDGFDQSSDCDDQDPESFPGAPGIDTDCMPIETDSSTSGCGCSSTSTSENGSTGLLCLLVLLGFGRVWRRKELEL